MESSAQRRLRAIQAHLLTSAGDDISHLQPNLSASQFFQSQTYSVVLPEKLNTGKWNVYRSARSPLKLVSRFPNHPEIGTLHDNFVHAVETYQDYKYLGTRVRQDGTVGEYTWMTYGEVGAAREAIGSGLHYHGIEKGGCIGIYFINRPEWLVVDHACAAYSFISVPLYDTLGPDAVKYVVNHADVQAIFCVPETLNTLLSFLSEIPFVRLVVVVGGIDEHLPSLPLTSGVKIVSYQKLLDEGRRIIHPFMPPKPEDVATICYTSGTTGTPKGVVLTHGNLIASVAGFSLAVQFDPSDIYISYLPLAHIYERTNQIMLVYFGGASGFYQGDTLKLMDDLAVLKPTVFSSVPRLYNRVYDGITNAVRSSGVLRERLFRAAYNSKKQAIMSGRNPSPMWDKLVFNKIKAKLGGRVRIMGSGASPLSPDIMDFLRVCFGCQVREGYGMTETSCLISLMDQGDNLSGHVGSPNAACGFNAHDVTCTDGFASTIKADLADKTAAFCDAKRLQEKLLGFGGNELHIEQAKNLLDFMMSEIKLVDVPEMNYTSEDQPYPRGEICVRGPTIFQGYHKEAMQTREVFGDDGWMHTGDIGLWLPGGRLKIIDRKKNILKLAQGEYIAPEKIENVYVKCRFVSQCFIYGDSFNSSLVAVVAVDPDALQDWAASEGIKYDDLGQLCNDPKAKAVVLSSMDEVGKEAQLRGFEFAKAVTLVLEPFTMENGLLTPTFKIKRPQAKEYFAKAISDMYSQLATSEPIQHKL